MTLLPRITTSPIVWPSRGYIVHVVVHDAHEVGRRVRLTLAGEERGPLGSGQLIPLVLSGHIVMRTVRFG